VILGRGSGGSGWGREVEGMKCEREENGFVSRFRVWCVAIYGLLVTFLYFLFLDSFI